MDLTIILFSFFRCVDLVAELSQNTKAQKEVISLIPLVAQAAHFKHYTQHLHLLETVCTQVTNFMMAMLLYCGSSKVLIIILTHSWDPGQAKHAAWPLLTQKLKYNSTKTGQDDETESRKTSKKDYSISNWRSYPQTLVGQRKKKHTNLNRP